MVVGCGSGSAGTKTASTTASREASAPARPAAGASGGKHAGKGQGGQSKAGGSAAGSPSIAAEEAAPGDHSIQEYGAEAEGGEREALLAAMHSFFRAIAASDYSRVCSGLLGANREQLQQFSKLQGGAGADCAQSLAKLLTPTAAGEAKKAAAATIGRVRVKGDIAFVLFRPPGATLSYFAMKREGGAWKAISLAPGTPLNPSLPGG